MDAEKGKDNKEEESVPLEDEEKVLPPAEGEVSGATEV